MTNSKQGTQKFDHDDLFMQIGLTNAGSGLEDDSNSNAGFSYERDGNQGPAPPDL